MKEGFVISMSLMNLKRSLKNNLRNNFKNIRFSGKVGNSEKKYGVLLLLSAFTVLNTGFTAQTTETLPTAEPAVVEAIPGMVPSDDMKQLIAEESRYVPSGVTISDSGSLTISDNNEQKQLLAEVVNNTLERVEDTAYMQNVNSNESSAVVPESGTYNATETVNEIANVDEGEDVTKLEEDYSLQYADVISMEATAYLPTDGSPEGLTAMGIPATYGIVAVDPRVIPLGTRVYIPGYGEALAADTGGAIKGYKIDLCMESYSECMDFGRRMVKVYVLK